MTASDNVSEDRCRDIRTVPVSRKFALSLLYPLYRAKQCPRPITQCLRERLQRAHQLLARRRAREIDPHAMLDLRAIDRKGRRWHHDHAARFRIRGEIVGA